jgi:Rap1a immunity proteins
MIECPYWRTGAISMKSKAAIGVAALLSVATILISVGAEGAEFKFNTVEDIYQLCKSSVFERMLCVGFISGVAAEMDSNAKMADYATDPRDRDLIREQSACGTGSNAETVQAFMTWADSHPEMREHNMLVGIHLALRETWPCK